MNDCTGRSLATDADELLRIEESVGMLSNVVRGVARSPNECASSTAGGEPPHRLGNAIALALVKGVVATRPREQT